MHSQVSPVFCAGYDSLDDNSSHKSRRKDIGIDMKSVKSSTKCRIPMSAKCCESLDPAVVFGLVDEKKFMETKVLWNSLPSTLAKLGKVQCFTFPLYVTEIKKKHKLVIMENPF